MATTPYFAEGTEAMVALEAMVDRVGVANVLYALQHICNAKADHVLANWQDEEAEGKWGKDGNICGCAATRIHTA